MLCPETAIFPNAFAPVAEFVIVMPSFVASVVRVIPVPAVRVNVSFVPSAATVVCPDTATLPNAFAPVAEFVIVISSLELSVVRVMPVPATSVRVSVVESATTLFCPDTAKVVNTYVFTTFAVSGQNSVVADSTTDTLTLVAGTGITLTTDNSNDEITITNSATGANAFGNVAVSGQTTVAADGTNDTLTLTAGTGITLTTDATNDGITITNSATGANAFGNIAVSGQSTVAADSTNDTVTFVAGSNMTITTNASGDTVTFASSGGGGGSQNLFSNIGVSGQGTIQADATTDTLTVVAGSGISLTTDTSADSLTITNTGTVNVANAASSIKEFKYDISSSTTTITGSDANSNTLAYEAEAIQVFLNGILLDPATDYTASNGTSVVLTDAAVNGDDVQIVAFNRKIVTANVGLSTFTGDGTTTAFTLSSDPVNENNTRVHICLLYTSPSPRDS